jgi:hypothetical protein
MSLDQSVSSGRQESSPGFRPSSSYLSKDEQTPSDEDVNCEVSEEIEEAENREIKEFYTVERSN